MTFPLQTYELVRQCEDCAHGALDGLACSVLQAIRTHADSDCQECQEILNTLVTQTQDGSFRCNMHVEP